MKLRVLAALLLLACAPQAAAAADPLPDPKTDLIVVPTSIAGVQLGQSLRSAARQWGHRSGCRGRLCSYGRLHGGRGTAYIQAGGEGVEYVDIQAGFQHDRPVFRGPLLKLETASGVGLRSPIAKLRSAYPQAYRAESGWRVDGPHGSYMRFGLSRVRVKGRTRIVSISIWR